MIEELSTRQGKKGLAPTRQQQKKTTPLQWLGRICTGIVGLILIAIVMVYVVTAIRFRKTWDVAFTPLSIPSDAESIERGRHLMTLAKCGECHGEDLGGKTIIDHPMMATLSGVNLTAGSGGIGNERSNTDLQRAIRYGLSTDFHGLLGMPTQEHFYFSDSELAAIIGAIRALPPVDRTLPNDKIGPLFRILYLTDQIELIGAEELDISGPRPADIPPGVTLEYGEHLVQTGGCYSCHGPALVGGKMAGAPPDWPPASNITPDVDDGIGSWTETDFFLAMREGIRPDGSAINPAMPWRYTQAMTTQELQSVWMFLQTVPVDKEE